jgi:hypothetical protein
MKAQRLPAVQPTHPQMKGRKPRLSFLQGPVPVPHPIHSYCKERLDRGSPVMAPEDSDRTAWSRAIPLGKAGRADKVRAEGAAEPEVAPAARGAASAGPVAEEAVECLAERLVAEEPAVEAECSVGADD